MTTVSITSCPFVNWQALLSLDEDGLSFTKKRTSALTVHKTSIVLFPLYTKKYVQIVLYRDQLRKNESRSFKLLSGSKIQANAKPKKMRKQMMHIINWQLPLASTEPENLFGTLVQMKAYRNPKKNKKSYDSDWKNVKFPD